MTRNGDEPESKKKGNNPCLRFTWRRGSSVGDQEDEILQRTERVWCRSKRNMTEG
jgi:hypothetical protein